MHKKYQKGGPIQWCLAILLHIVSLYTVICLEFNLNGKHGKGYYLEVSIGDPPQKFNVLIDTGSTNFAIAAAENNTIDTYFIASNSSTFKSYNKNVMVQYTEGNWSGELGSDVLYFATLNSTPKVKTDISLIQKTSNFYISDSGWQGILGLGYSAIARPDSSVKSWLDSFSEQKNLSSIGFMLELCGTRASGKSDHFGHLELLTDAPKKSSEILTAPLVRDWFYEVSLVELSINGVKINATCSQLNDDKTIIDSGTTNLRLPEQVFKDVVKYLDDYTKQQNIALTAEFWDAQETSCFDTKEKWDNFPNISLSIASSKDTYFTLDLPASSYIREAYENVKEIKNCYKVALEKSTAGTVLGVVVMEGYEIFFNRTAKTVGFSIADCGPRVGLRGPFRMSTTEHQDLLLCAHPRIDKDRIWNGVSYFIMPTLIITLLIIISLGVPILRWILRTRAKGLSTSNVFLALNRSQLIAED